MKKGFFIIELSIAVMLMSFLALFMAQCIGITINWYNESKQLINATDVIVDCLHKKTAEQSLFKNIQVVLQEHSFPSNSVIVHCDLHEINASCFENLHILSASATWTTQKGVARTVQGVTVRMLS